MPHVVEINDAAQLDQYRLVWQSLLAGTRGASIFQTLDWLQAYWRHYGQNQRLRTLVVSSGGDVVGILPLTVISERTRIGTVRTLTYPLHDWGWFYGPIGPNPTAALAAGLRYLADAPRDWDRLDLRWIDEDRTDHGRTRRAIASAGLAARKRVWKQAAIVDTGGSWHDYLAAKSSKFRNNVRRAEKRFYALADARFQRHRPDTTAGDDDLLDVYDECVALAERSWQGNSTSGTTLCHQQVRDFLREVHTIAARQAMLDLCVLRSEGKLIAFGYNYRRDGYVSGLRVGYDDQYRRVGLGTVLYTHMLRDSFERGDQVFDFGPGYLDSKRPWLTDMVNSYQYCHYAPWSAKSQILRLKQWWSAA